MHAEKLHHMFCRVLINEKRSNFNLLCVFVCFVNAGNHLCFGLLCCVRVLYCIILYCVVLYCIVFKFKFNSFFLFFLGGGDLICIVLFCVVLCCVVLCCVVLCCAVLCCV